ncbi:hypothetical protein [Microbacterium sp. Se63.02b]|uniref:hypothetical protein n=1 Tax=Microbacterium sp. Se63.02b TaxID=2709304 RepID=UPI001FCE6B21|nr:hypothetical protein [Microbacterium sp. Se63.02b]
MFLVGWRAITALLRRRRSAAQGHDDIAEVHDDTADAHDDAVDGAIGGAPDSTENPAR